MCEVASNSKKVKPFKMFNLYSSMNRRGADDNDQPKELETTGHDRFCQIRHSRYIRNSRPQLHFLCSPFVFFPSVFLALARFYYFFFCRIFVFVVDGGEVNLACSIFSATIPYVRSSFRKKHKKTVRRAQSAAEFDQQTLTAAHKRSIFK